MRIYKASDKKIVLRRRAFLATDELESIGSLVNKKQQLKIMEISTTTLSMVVEW